MFSLLLLAALASPKPLDPSDPESLVANIICGEAGNDDALGMLVAHVIENRMALLDGTRKEKIVKVLMAPKQFNGRCRIKEPTYVRVLARQLVNGDMKQVWKPAWMNRRVRWFTEEATASKWLKKVGKKRPPSWLSSVKVSKRFKGVYFFEKNL
jgi:hypothetical protein